MSQLQIRKATKKKLKLRLALEGPSGSGKTYTALAICKEMGWRTLLVDTEHRSSERYADVFSFDIIDLDPPFSPDRYISCIEMAEQGGYDAVILDSLSHEWFGQGGVLEMVDEEMVRQRTSQAMLGWKVVTPKHTRLLERLIRNSIHLISCMRSKQEYSIEKDDAGKTTIKKLGMAPIQKEGMDYEHDIVGSLDTTHHIVFNKTRCPDLDGRTFFKPGKDVADVIKAWLENGEDAKPEDFQPPQPAENVIGEEQLKELKDLADKKGLKLSAVRDICVEKFGKGPKSITLTQFNELKESL